VRKKVTKTFDDKTLERAFGDIEIFFAIFPKDEPIKEASIELVVSILKAIEDAIGFFIKSQGEVVVQSRPVCFCAMLKSTPIRCQGWVCIEAWGEIPKGALGKHK
jgi:hypothetical protein